MSSPYQELGFASELLHYRCCSLLAILQWASLALRPFQKRRVGIPGFRSPSDAYWFLPVFAWGVDSTVYVAQYFSGDVGSPSVYWPLGRAIASIGVLSTLLVLGFAAEKVARTVGLAARPAQAAVPVSVVAAIVSGLVVWGLALFMVLPITRVGRGLDVGQRMPCLPEQSFDVGTDRPAVGCSIWLGTVEYFVATRDPRGTTVDYIETATVGFTTEEGIGVGSRLRDVVEARGTRPAMHARGVCGSLLPSYWIARFDTKVCGGDELKPDVEVRRLFKR